MPFLLLWHPRAGSVVHYPSDVFEGVLLGPPWAGRVLGRSFEARAVAKGWTARQIARWEAKYGRAWEGKL